MGGRLVMLKLLLSCSVVAGLLVGCGQKKAERRLEDVPVVSCLVVSPAGGASQPAPGAGYMAVIKGGNEVDLSFKIGGIIDLVGPQKGKDWEPGTVVEKGALLAKLHQNELQQQLQAAQARADLDRSEFERVKSLYESSSVSLQELERQRSAQKASAAALGQAQQAVADALITAPFHGTVLSCPVKAGETVGAGQAVLRFADLDVLDVEVGVPEVLVSGLAVGVRYPVSIPALGIILEGAVKEIGAATRREDGLFRVLLKLNNEKGLVRPGMTASVDFYSRQERRQALLIPLSALIAAGSLTNAPQLEVFVLGPDSAVHKKKVTTGEIRDSQVEVLSGLAAGDKVVVSGAANLYEGQKVVEKAVAY